MIANANANDSAFLAKIVRDHREFKALLRACSDNRRELGRMLKEAQNQLSVADWGALVDSLNRGPWGLMAMADEPNPTDEDLEDQFFASLKPLKPRGRGIKPVNGVKADPNRMAYIGRKPGTGVTT